MFNITEDVAAILGEGVAPDELSMITRDLYERLELQVGTRIAAQLTDQQLDEFETFLETGDNDGALEWLQREVPSYRSIVVDEWASVLDWFVGAAGLMQTVGA